MALRDVREQLKRKGGFEYFVRGGTLELEAIGSSGESETAARETHALRGGSVTLTRVKLASDEDRLLAGLRGKASSGTRSLGEIGTQVAHSCGTRGSRNPRPHARAT